MSEITGGDEPPNVAAGRCPVAHDQLSAIGPRDERSHVALRVVPEGPRPTITAYQLYDQPLQIRQASATRDWMRQTEAHKAMRCLPLRIASQSGWIVRNTHRMVVVWTGDKGADAIKILYHPERPDHLLARSFLGDGILTFQLPYLFRTSPGHNLLVRGPANCPKDGISPLEALVETDWLEASFLMSWQITRPRVPIVFEVGEPICMIVPQRRGELERFEARVRRIEDEPQLAAGFEAWRQSRNTRNARRAVEGPTVGWQMDYAYGMNVSGTNGSEHQTRLDLARFEAPGSVLDETPAQEEEEEELEAS